MDKHILKVCYVLSYRAPWYVRTKTLITALRGISDIKLYEACNTRSGFIRYLETFVKFLWIRYKENPDIFIVGFRGHEIYWLLRLFAWRKKFVFDAMMSPYDSLVNEKKKVKKTSLLAKLLLYIESSILNDANLLITDTELHVEFFSEMFGISKDKIHPIPVGADEELFDSSKIDQMNFENDFTVLFYATFLPLHGVEIVLKSASLLKHLPIKIIIIGGKDNPEKVLELMSFKKKSKLKNLCHINWVEYEKLPEYIKGADLCLGGPFGGTSQARRVITGKTYQFMCMGKPTIIGKINQDVGLVDRENCFMVDQLDHYSLANAIKVAYSGEVDLKEIGRNARLLYLECYSTDIIQCKLSDLLYGRL